MLVLAECVGRMVFGVNRPPLYRADPEIEYTLQPNQSSIVKRQPFLTNQYGMRSPELSERRPPGGRRIAAFGDSILTANAVGQDDLATSVLAKELTSRGAPTEVANISAGGWGPGNWLAYAKRYGFFDADTVVLVLSSHDYADNPTFSSMDPYTTPTHYPRSALVFYAMKKAAALASHAAAQPVQPSEDEITKALSDLRAFLAMARQDGRRVIVFQHFERGELDGNQKPGAARIASLCKDMGIESASLLDAELANRAGAYDDGIHLTTKGQRVLASEIAKHL